LAGVVFHLSLFADGGVGMDFFALEQRYLAYILHHDKVPGIPAAPDMGQAQPFGALGDIHDVVIPPVDLHCDAAERARRVMAVHPADVLEQNPEASDLRHVFAGGLNLQVFGVVCPVSYCQAACQAAVPQASGNALPLPLGLYAILL